MTSLVEEEVVPLTEAALLHACSGFDCLSKADVARLWTTLKAGSASSSAAPAEAEGKARAEGGEGGWDWG